MTLKAESTELNANVWTNLSLHLTMHSTAFRDNIRSECSNSTHYSRNYLVIEESAYFDLRSYPVSIIYYKLSYLAFIPLTKDWIGALSLRRSWIYLIISGTYSWVSIPCKLFKNICSWYYGILLVFQLLISSNFSF